MSIITITDYLSYIPEKKNPLSSDIGIIKGKEFTWLYDVGNGSETLDELSGIQGRINVILSHFHPDHASNIHKVNFENLYQGANTKKYTKVGIVPENHLIIEDGVKLHFFDIPAAHAKGCLGLEVNDEYVFVGDSTYPGYKPTHMYFNTGFLKEQINIFEKLKGDKFLISHQFGHIQSKEEVLSRLKHIYDKRDPKSPFIDAGGYAKLFKNN